MCQLNENLAYSNTGGVAFMGPFVVIANEQAAKPRPQSGDLSMLLHNFESGHRQVQKC